MSNNRYDGIASVGNNTWFAEGETEPLSQDWLTKGFELMQQAEVDRERWQMETAAEYREAMKDRAFAARQDALTQACIDVGCPFPDPLNPPIISKALYDKINARADEILATAKGEQ